MNMLMKLVHVLTVVFTFSTWAAEISPDQARTAAGNWIVRKASQLDASFASADVRDVRSVRNGKGRCIYHVAEIEGGGFVVTSGDTKISPIVAFSSTGDYVPGEGSPLEVLLSGDQGSRIDRLDVDADENTTSGHSKARLSSALPNSRTEGSTASVAESEWASLLADEQQRRLKMALNSVSNVRVAPLLQTEWNQERWKGDGSLAFNYLTPKQYPCGCVATAGAQIMKYWEYPSEIRKFSKSCMVDSNTNYMSSYSGTVEWNNMPLTYRTTPSLNEQQRRAIGRLTLNVGIAVKMKYTEKSSSANSSNLITALKTDFGYASGTFVWFYLLTGDGDEFPSTVAIFKNALYASLDAEMPVIMSITGTVGGHAIIADGYGYDNSEKLYTHLNMGWSGQDDVWYNLVNEDIDTTEGTFETIKGIGFNIHPSKVGEVLSGRVVNSSGSAVSNAKVCLYDQSGNLMDETSSNAKGIYHFRVTGGTKCVVCATSGTYESSDVTVDMSVSSEDGNISDGGRSGNLWGVDLTLKPKTTPDIPKSPSASISGGKMTWNAVDGANYYKVYRTTNPFVTPEAYTVWQTSRSCDIEVPSTEKTAYFYFVKASKDGTDLMASPFSRTVWSSYDPYSEFHLYGSEAFNDEPCCIKMDGSIRKFTLKRVSQSEDEAISVRVNSSYYFSDNTLTAYCGYLMDSALNVSASQNTSKTPRSLVFNYNGSASDSNKESYWFYRPHYIYQAGATDFYVSGSQSVSATGGVYSVEVTAVPSDASWSVSSSVPWITPYVRRHSGSGTLGYKVEASTSFESRRGTLTFICGSIEKSWNVSQEAGSYMVTYRPGTYGTGSQQTATKTKDVALKLAGAIFTRSGYVQTGWSKTANGSAKVYDLGASYTYNEPITLYPYWTVLPNLKPFKPNGWSSPLVVSGYYDNHTNHTATSFSSAEDLHVSYAYTCEGADITEEIRTYLYIDGVKNKGWYIEGLKAGWHSFTKAYSIGSLSVGTHTIKVVFDALSGVDESNESDNTYTRTITITEAKDYKIVFTSGEAMAYQNVGVGKVAKLNPCTFTAPAGKRFAGWRRKDNGRRYDDEMLVFNLASNPGEVVVFTAIWELTCNVGNQ